MLPVCPEHLGAEQAEAVARDVLVVAQQELPGEHRPAEGQRRQHEDGQRQQRWAARLERFSGGLSGRHAASPRGSSRNGTAAPNSVMVSRTREASASAVAAPIPSGPCSIRMKTPSRTPRPPGANSARNPARYDAVNTAMAGMRPSAGTGQQAPRQQPERHAVSDPGDRRWPRRRRRLPAAGGVSGHSASGAAIRSSRRSTGRPAAAAPTASDRDEQEHQRRRRRPDAPTRGRAHRSAPTTAAPVPMASTWRMTADPVAAHGGRPRPAGPSPPCPATAHTLPGRYLPRLETVQMLAAVQPSSRWPHAREHDRARRRSAARTSATRPCALRISHAGSTLPVERLALEAGPSSAPAIGSAKPTMATPSDPLHRADPAG